MRSRASSRGHPATPFGLLVISVVLALAVLGCGGTARRSSSSSSSSSSSVSRVVPAWKPGVRATAHSDVCLRAARRVVGRAAGIGATAVRERRGFARSLAPECVFSARSLVLSVSVSGAPQAYAVMERGAEEQAQIFGAKRFTPAPQLILGEGVGSYWFPAEHLVMTTEGVNLITATIVRWPGVAHRRWKHVAAAAAAPYLGRVSKKFLRGPAP